MALDERPRRRWLPIVACIGAAVAGIGLAAGDAAARDAHASRDRAAHATVDATPSDLHLIDAATSVYLSAAGTIVLGAGLALGRTRRASRR